MTLYEADLDKIAVEVKSVSRKSKKAAEAKPEAKPAQVEEPKKKTTRKRKGVEPVPEHLPEIIATFVK